MKRYSIAGLLVWVPLVITIWVLNFLVTTLDQTLLLLPESARPDALLGVHIPGLGVVLSFAIVLLTGVFATNFFGAQLVRSGKRCSPHPGGELDLLDREAGLRHAVLRSGKAFRKALLVQWPHEGTWTIAFLTGTPGGEVARSSAEEHVSVYVPTTPNPTARLFHHRARKRTCSSST